MLEVRVVSIEWVALAMILSFVAGAMVGVGLAWRDQK